MKKSVSIELRWDTHWGPWNLESQTEVGSSCAVVLSEAEDILQR